MEILLAENDLNVFPKDHKPGSSTKNIADYSRTHTFDLKFA